MRGLVSHIEVTAPETLEDALAAMRAGDVEGQPWTPVAGGTDVYVLLNAGRAVGDRVISLHGLRPELRFISLLQDRLRVGALTTFRDLARSTAITTRLPMLAAAARTVGAAAIQNRGTVGGNIANASPAGDSLPVWSALDAQVVMRSTSGSRRLPFSDLFLGYRSIDRRPDELISEVRVTLPSPRVRQYFRKVGTRKAQAISKLVLAGLIELDRGKVADVRVALGSVAATPVRASQTETLLRGEKLTPALVDKAVETLKGELSPIDDVRSTATYRLTVAGNLLRDFLTAP